MCSEACREKQEEKAAIRAAEKHADRERLTKALKLEAEADMHDQNAKRNSKRAAIEYRSDQTPLTTTCILVK